MIWDKIFLLGIFIALAVMFEVVRANMEKILEANPRMRNARADFEAATAEANEHIQAMRDAQRRLLGVNDAIDLAKNRINKLNDEIAEIQPDKPVVVRELGKPIKSNTMFDAVVANRYMKFHSRPAIIEKMNPIWGRQVEIVVWAPSRVDAKRAIEREFPGDLGFEVEYGRSFAEIQG
jgi:hypothetical protein